MKTVFIVAAVGVLAACVQGVRGEPVPAGGAIAAERPVAKLGIISRQDVEREMEPGAGCTLETSGGAVLVAVLGDAIARPANALVHFRHSGSTLNELFEGGRFSREDFAIRIAPLESHATRTGEEETTRRVQVTVADGSRSDEFTAQWKCGS